VERTGRDLRERRRLLDLDDPFRHLAEHAAVVELLERLAPAMPARHLPDEQDQRRRVLVGGMDADRGVGGAGRTGDEADAGAAGELAVGVGHVRGARLVACDHESDRRVVQRVEDGDVALAWNAERRLDAVDDELVDEHLRAGSRHKTRGRSKKTVGRWSFGLSSSAGST
jgi:hypothetical protein